MQVTARGWTLIKSKVETGMEVYGYRRSLSVQYWFLNLIYNLQVKGLKNVPTGKPTIYLMKHRRTGDVGFHGMGHALINSGITEDEINWMGIDKNIREIIDSSPVCRFVIKSSLLDAPFGKHLIRHGCIPVHQDIALKIRNDQTPIEKRREAMSFLIEKQSKYNNWFWKAYCTFPS